MKYCEKCKVNVEGNRKYCPLCQSQLTELTPENREAFPKIPTVYRQYHLFFRLLIFLSVAAVVICSVLNALFPAPGPWALFVAGGVACLWVSLAILVKKRRNIPKNIIYQTVAISILAVVWDLCMGWRGWSVDYVIPIVCGTAMIVLVIITRTMRRYVEDRVVYILLDGWFSLVPLVFLLTGKLSTQLPSLICIGIGVLSIAAILVFDWEAVRAEVRRRMHL